MKKLLSLVTLFMCGIHCNVNGQTNNATVDNVAAPSTSINNNSINNSLSGTGSGSGSAYNMDMFSGTANINIPIYNYSVDGIDAGISLSYNTGGIRVDQLASSIGLGWNLNAGASITRQVNGLEDEATVPAIGPWYHTPPTPGTPQMSGAWGFRNPEKDNDKFTINFGNRSVDFILEFTSPPSDPTSPLSPDQPILTATSGNVNFHILPLVDGTGIYYYAFNSNNSNNTSRFDSSMETQQSSQILSFQVIDEHGNQYFFDRGDYEYKKYVDTTVNPRVTHMYYPIDKWNLTMLITWKGDTVTYKYRHFDNVSYPLQRSVLMKEVREYNSTDVTSTSYNILPHTQLLTDSIIYWSGTLSEISEIDYPNRIVATFNIGSQDRLDLTGAYAIQNVTLEGKYDANVDNKLKYQFNQAYFTTTANTEQPVANVAHDQFGYRLKLTGIDRYGTDLATFEPYYRFTYNTSVVLPQHCSPAQDVYGYYNGVFTGSTTYTPSSNGSGQASWVVNGLSNSANFLPYHTFTYLYNSNAYSVSYGLSKSNNINYAKACLLTSMTNGLGGTTSFAYKDHVLSNPPGDTYTYLGTTVNTDGLNVPNYTFTGPHYYASVHSTEIPANNNPTLNMEGTDVNDGVCIDNITTTDGFNPDNSTVTQYTYAGGMRFFAGGYYWYPTVTSQAIPWASSAIPIPYLPDLNGNTSSVEESWLERIYTNSIVSSQDYINGANHGYSDVTATTYGTNNEQVSSHRVLFTNVISQPNEFDSLVYIHQPPPPYVYASVAELPNTSRIQASCGIFQHTMPRLFMDKHAMGLPVEIDDYDKNGFLLHQTTNLYTEHSAGYGTYGTGHGTVLYNVDHPLRLFTVYHPGTLSTLHYNYIPFSESVALLKTATSTDFSAGLPMATTKNYFYDINNNLVNTYWTDSKNDLYWSNDQYFYQLTYLDYTMHMDFTHLYTNTYKLILTSPSSWGQIGGSGIGGQWYSPTIFGGTPLFQVTSAFITRGTSAGVTINDNKNYTIYDGQNNVVETKYKNNQEVYSALWDTRIGQKVASVVNSAYTDMAYTSFEGPFTSGLDSNKGHWNFNEGNVAYDPASKPITGKYYYNMNNDIISEYPLVSGKNYYISFWMQGTPSVYYTSNNVRTGLAAPTAQNTVNGWTLYTGYIPGTGASIGIGSVGAAKLDELRLYPADATMETFTYEPLLGMSSHCDDRNNVTYMQYDVQGRPYITRDINGNIIKLTKQVNQGNDN